MAGIDPITLGVVGAGIGAISNKDDPIKGAILGGAAGFTGGTALGAGAAGTAAGTTVGAGGIGGAAGGTGLTAATLGGGVPAGAGLGTASGGITGLTASAPAVVPGMGASGLLGTASTAGNVAAPFAAAASPMMLQGASQVTPMQGLQAARLMAQPSGGTRTNVSPPLIRGGKEVNSASPIQGLLAAQIMRRRQPMSLLG